MVEDNYQSRLLGFGPLGYEISQDLRFDSLTGDELDVLSFEFD